jgi:hypothetical protein
MKGGPSEASAMTKAAWLLEAMRRTPMVRGRRFNDHSERVWVLITRNIERQGVTSPLARRIARQLLCKCDTVAAERRVVWRAIGTILHEEIEHLQDRLGLVDRQVIVALPKLSARQVEALLHDLRRKDPDIARTILNVSLDAAEPVPAAYRYLTEYHNVLHELQHVDPAVARTFANATFMACLPATKAIEHFRRFSALMSRFQGDVAFVRSVARAACRATNAVEAAQRVILNYDGVVDELTAQGFEPDIARSIAGIACTCADPPATARRLVDNFEALVAIVTKTHPNVARSVALAACRATDPVAAARTYTANYDLVVRAINKVDPRRAHVVASQTFRSDNPLRWAKRYLAQLQTSA